MRINQGLYLEPLMKIDFKLHKDQAQLTIVIKDKKPQERI